MEFPQTENYGLTMDKHSCVLSNASLSNALTETGQRNLHIYLWTTCAVDADIIFLSCIFLLLFVGFLFLT